MKHNAPLLWLAVLGSLALAACQPGDDPPPADQSTCTTNPTPIADIQGREFRSPRSGEEHTVQGVVTFVTENGFYLQSLQPDDDPNTSEGLFVEQAAAVLLEPGQVAQATGMVFERGEGRDTLTAVAATTAAVFCGQFAALPSSGIELPLQTSRREAIEGMRIAVNSRSFVTDVYRLTDGQLSISSHGPLPIPTEVAWPGEDARRQATENRYRSLPVQLATDDAQLFPLGSELLSDSGILGNDGRRPRLYLEAEARVAAPELPKLPEPAEDELRIVNINLYNYFNGNGINRRFPAERGPETADEFADKRRKLRAALEFLNPHILAVQELENDGFGPHSAASSLLEDLQQASGRQWTAAGSAWPAIGTDQITVGLFYRPDRVITAGPARQLEAAPFDLLNRTPLGQTFLHPASETRFFVSTNHFKSKGRCPEQGRDRDQNDGQSCWNAARVEAATRLAPWVLTHANERADGLALILGDLNAYRMEDPLRALVNAGFNDLTGSAGDQHRFTFLYYGETGTLDHALATQAMLPLVSRAQIVNMNSPYPPRADLEPAWLRFSDHDPVVVDLRFNQSATEP